MRLAVLTTETPHHAFFAQQLSKKHPIGLILNETNSIVPPFDTSHQFEEERDCHEKNVWFKGNQLLLPDSATTLDFPNLNSPESITSLAQFKPDAVVVFGTGKLSAEIINICPKSIINLHGGDPERYRGLDSHLWAIYHKDWDAMVTTLHQVDTHLDTGDIIDQSHIPLSANMPLHALRQINTEVCVELTTKALTSFVEKGCFSRKVQKQKGRYYSFMPTVLKQICYKNFTQYTSAL